MTTPATHRKHGRTKPGTRISDHTVESFSDFVSFVEKTFENSDAMLFRGQRRDWLLRPKIARLRLRAGSSVVDTERLLLNDFKLQALSFVDFVPQSDWEWLSLAQHYGMATRLLDWTTNPLAALWFAVERPAEPNHSDEMSAAVVWALDPGAHHYVQDLEKDSPFDGARTRVFRPRHIARRITVQSGWFTVHKYVKGEKRFVPLELQAAYKSVLTKIIIPANLFCDVRWGLDRYGVNAASMLTDLAGLCRHIEWCHSLFEDEPDDWRAARRASQQSGQSNS